MLTHAGPADGSIAEFVVDIANRAIAEHIAAAVTGSGSGLLEMSAKGTDLEDMFLKLTGGASA
jgi:hypothetical protein